jgi:hypothetical protein
MGEWWDSSTILDLSIRWTALLPEKEELVFIE